MPSCCQKSSKVLLCMESFDRMICQMCGGEWNKKCNCENDLKAEQKAVERQIRQKRR